MSIHITVYTTPAGVVVNTAGPLHAIDDAAWVARSMIEHAAPLFAGGKPVLLGGTADPVQHAGAGLPDCGFDDTPESCLCGCNLELTTEELDSQRCSACGKAVVL